MFIQSELDSINETIQSVQSALRNLKHLEKQQEILNTEQNEELPPIPGPQHITKKTPRNRTKNRNLGGGSKASSLDSQDDFGDYHY